MDHLWTWGGRYFGYRIGDLLWTADGRHVGVFNGDEVYGRDGRYVGQLRGSRLITCTSRHGQVHPPFDPSEERAAVDRHEDYVSNVMLEGYRDFPAPDEL